MKKMNKVLALLAFAGVVTGVSLHGAAADVAAHPLANAVVGIFDRVVGGGFAIEDLKKPADAVQIFSAVNEMAWHEIAKQRVAGTSFTRYFTQKEVQCVINGLNHVVTAFEVAAPVIWKNSSEIERNTYKDAVIVAIDAMVADLKAKITHAADILGHFTKSADKVGYIADVTTQMDALKLRVTNVFTVKPVVVPAPAGVLNAQGVGAHVAQAHLPKDLVLGHALLAEEAKASADKGYFRKGCGLVWGATKWTAKTAAVIAMVYGTTALAQANGWM